MIPPSQDQSSSTSPWHLPRQQAFFFLMVLLVVTTILFLRLYQLDKLQRELYGDIAVLYEYVLRIKNGELPLDFSLSTGPLYHYLIMPIVTLTGLNYFGFKLASVITSLGVLLGTFLYGRRLINDYFGLLSLFIAGVSSWLLIFSRLGNSQILVPCLTVISLWLVVRIAQDGRRLDVILCAIISSLGLYVYPQSFILPAVIWLTLLTLRWTGHPIQWAYLRIFILVTLLGALPFIIIFAQDPVALSEGYIGVKLNTEGNAGLVLLNNIGKTLLSFHVRGDSNFRSNISGRPHLDWLSGLLLVVGLIYWLNAKRRALAPALFIPLLLIPVPSMLVLSAAGDVPSASRTLGVAPVIYVLVASGLWWLYWFISGRGYRWPARLVAGLILLGILALNSQRYFQDYMAGLPYNNTPIGQLITDYANSLPQDTHLYLVDCCWQDDMPEPKSIEYSINHPERFHRIDSATMLCEQLLFLERPSVFIWSFYTPFAAPQLESCQSWLPAQLYTSENDLPAFHAAPLCCFEEALSEFPGLDYKMDELDYQTAVMSGENIGIRHSTLDMGTVNDLFDQNRQTLLRGRAANPLVLELRLTEPQAIESLELDLGTMPHFQVRLTLFYADGTQTQVSEEYENLPADPHISLTLPPGTEPITVLRIEIKDLLIPAGFVTHIHVREIQLNGS